jgi:hypothetical protein
LANKNRKIPGIKLVYSLSPNSSSENRVGNNKLKKNEQRTNVATIKIEDARNRVDWWGFRLL